MRVLLVDDDQEFVGLLSDFLVSEGFELSTAYNGKEALTTLQSKSFDLCVLDVMMPVMGGLDTLRQIRATFTHLPVLMLTAKSETFDRVLGLELGADDYVSKPVEPRELAARIRAILRRTHVEWQNTVQEGKTRLSKDIEWDDQKREFIIRGEMIELTGIEYEVLKQLARNIGQVVDKETLSKNALHRALLPFDRSLDVHISNIRKKINRLGVNIKSVRGRGYQLIV